MDIVRGGVILVVYAFVLIAIYIFVSGPFDDIVTTFENVNSSASDSYVESGAGTIRTVFDFMFAGLILVPTVWFVYWAFSRDPDWRYYR